MMDMNVKMNKMMDIVEEKMPEDTMTNIQRTARSGRWFLSHTLASHLNHMT